jgi:uncharacterized protein YndB with AHSA1/START domain
MRALPVLLLAFGAGAPAAAAVKSSGPDGFVVEMTATAKAPPGEVYAMLGRPAEWWNPAHSYSGKAANLSLDLRAGGCFCERLTEGGGVEHMRVVLAWPGQMLRLQGGLGPLQGEAVAGSLTWALKAVPGGTEIVQTYRVAGQVEDGADKLAPIVDKVLAEQLNRLQARLSR